MPPVYWRFDNGGGCGEGSANSVEAQRGRPTVEGGFSQPHKETTKKAAPGRAETANCCIAQPSCREEKARTVALRSGSVGKYTDKETCCGQTCTRRRPRVRRHAAEAEVVKCRRSNWVRG
jgi:hypothetical protein